MSAVLAIAEPRHIKATHRRRRKATAGRFVQRYYDPAIGRFLSVDPVASDTNNAQNFNRYRYADDNPYRFTDPDGRDTYLVNRDLRAIGDLKDSGTRAQSRNNPLTHTFVITTGARGTIEHAYSWGNDANPEGWSRDQKLDLDTARQALDEGLAEHVGDAKLDAFVAQEYKQLDKKENDHPNLFVANNCKAEANKLVEGAREHQKAQEQKKEPPVSTRAD